MNQRARIIVTGLVQGVNFRRYTQMTARTLGVCGWTRNLPTGAVESCCEGEREAVLAMIEWCRNGPPSARVDSVDVFEEQFTGEFDSFTIRF